jgi:hypothetical protein
MSQKKKLQKQASRSRLPFIDDRTRTVQRKVPEFQAVRFGPIQVNLNNLSSKIPDPRERNSRKGVKSIPK